VDSVKRDRGSAAIEMAIIAPAVITFFALIVLAGRVALMNQTIDAAAYNASRTASLSRTQAVAQADADLIANQTLAAQGIHCETYGINVNVSEFTVPAGQAATVQVQVTCAVRISDIWLPFMPGTINLQSEFTSPLDLYRGRS
jgi:Flp pilus assembly protein TadG